MQRLVCFLLALVFTFAVVGALAAAASGFPCDFVRVARRHAPACRPTVLVAAAGGAVNGS